MKAKAIRFFQNKYVLYPLLVALPVLVVFISLFVGVYKLSGNEVLSAIFNPKSPASGTRIIVWYLRFPRAMAAAFVGASLAVSGAAYQGVFRNPLVNSGMLGVSNGAGFGACLAIVAFGGGVSVYFCSFACAIIAVILAWFTGRIYGKTSSVTLILGGVVVSAFFGALVSIMKYIADPYSQLPSITFWFMGSFAETNYTHFYAFIPMTIGILLIFLCRTRINVLSVGDKEAQALGINVKLYKTLIVGGATLATASAVCISGTIGWVGLVIPHIGRMIVGNNNARLIPVSASLGAVFLVIVDIICRSVTSSELPIGIVTALIGTPFFVYLLKRTKGKQWNG